MERLSVELIYRNKAYEEAVLAVKSAIWNLVKFVFREENGHEEAVDR